jgi:hypothetical protein
MSQDTHVAARTGAERGTEPRVAATFYLVTTVALVVLVTKAQLLVLPDGLATHVGHNSEVLALALLLAAGLDGFRPLALRSPRLSATVAVGLFVLGLFLVTGPVPATVKTLNEPVFAASVLWLYVLLRRPLRWALGVPAVLLAVVVLGYHTSTVTLQAESICALILAPVSLDLADRRLLDRSAADRPEWRWAWTAFLLVFPVLLMVVKRQGLEGVAADIVRYPSRGTEAFWGLALVHLYFAARLRVSSRFRGVASENG